jgi:hypothetical protein
VRSIPILLLALMLAVMIPHVASAEVVENPMVDYGNGVLYFTNAHEVVPFAGFGEARRYQDFGDALSQYLGERPYRRVVSVVTDTKYGGATRGFYVIVENVTPIKTVCRVTDYYNMAGAIGGFECVQEVN